MYTRFTYGQRLTNKASIVTAEIKAIFKRIELLLYVPSISAILSSVRTRYLYVLQFLHNGFLHNSILVQVLHEYHSLPDHQVSFVWLSSHMSIPGNEAADKAAKEALNKFITPLFIPHTDYKPVIKEYVM